MFTSILAAQAALTQALARRRPPFVHAHALTVCQSVFKHPQWDVLYTPACIALRLVVTSPEKGQPPLGHLMVDFNGAVFVEGLRPDADHSPILAAQYDAAMDALHAYAEAREAHDKAHPAIDGKQAGAILAKALLLTVRKGQAAGDAFIASLANARPAFVPPERVVH